MCKRSTQRRPFRNIIAKKKKPRGNIKTIH